MTAVPRTQWFFMNGGERRGPVSEVELIREVAAVADPGRTLVWRAGLPGWVPLNEVPDLAARLPPPDALPAPADGHASSDDPPLDRPGQIAGWLVLPAFGLLRALVIDGLELFKSLSGLWKAFGLETLFEAVIVGVLLAFELVVAAFFFYKHRWTRWIYIFFLASHLALMALYLLIHQLEPDPQTADAPKEFTRSLIAAIVWIPYFLVSRRVKVTFTR